VNLERTFQVQVESRNGGPTTATGAAVGSLGVEVKRSLESRIHSDLNAPEASAGINLNMVDLSRSVNTLNDRDVARFCLEAISGQLSQSADFGPVSVTAGVEAGPDWDLCFFGVNLDVTFKHQLQLSGVNVSGETSGSVALRFGPGLRAYAYLAQRVGVPAVERFLIRIVPRFAERGALMGVLRAAGIWAFAIQAGYDVMRISQSICRSAWQRGVARGQAHAFARAYVYSVYMGSAQSSNPSDRVVRLAVQAAERDAYHLGFTALRQGLEERFNERRVIPVGYFGFATRDDGLAEMANRMGSALDSGAPMHERY
jgi:hypothetical protein